MSNTIMGASSGGSDSLVGTSGNDVFRIEGGNDTITGTGGNETIDFEDATVGVYVDVSKGTATGWGTQSFSGISQVYGGAGSDTLMAGSGNDVLVAGSGNSVLRNTTGDAILIGGSLKAGKYNSADLVSGYAALAAAAAQWGSAQHTMAGDLAAAVAAGGLDSFYGGTSAGSATWALYAAGDPFPFWMTGYLKKTQLV